MPGLDAGKVLNFKAGDVIIREGEFDTCAYRILSGHVEVFRDLGSREVVLARLGPDQFFGEMNLVLEATRAASVRAIEPCAVRVITQQAFNRLLQKDPKSALPMLRVLFERLRIMNAKYLHALETQAKSEALAPAAPQSPAPTAPASGTRARPVLVLRGSTPEAQKALGKNPLEIRSFPFRIGRKVPQAGSDAFSLNDLYLEDAAPFNVSRNHCAIDMLPNGMYVVEDRGSTLGTQVNGETIGIQARRFESFLTKTENALHLGAPKSAFQFTLTLQPGR